MLTDKRIKEAKAKTSPDRAKEFMLEMKKLLMEPKKDKTEQISAPK